MPRQNFVHRTYILIKCDKPVLQRILPQSTT